MAGVGMVSAPPVVFQARTDGEGAQRPQQNEARTVAGNEFAARDAMDHGDRMTSSRRGASARLTQGAYMDGLRRVQGTDQKQQRQRGRDRRGQGNGGGQQQGQQGQGPGGAPGRQGFPLPDLQDDGEFFV